MADEIKTPDGETPAEYPYKYITTVGVKGGELTMRPIRPDDAEAMARLYATFSQETIYHRFFSYVSITPNRVKRLTNIDYHSQMAIVAEGAGVDGPDDILGVARYNTPEGAHGEAEIAIVVGDPYQCRGIGTALLLRLVQVARAEGFSFLYGLVHYDNRPAQRLFEKVPDPHRITDNGTEWRYEIDLKATP